MVVVDLENNVIEGRLNPSSDTPTHAVLYKEFPEIGGIVHTHSTWAAAWAQSGLDVPAMGTTHADTFYGSVPCARYLSQYEIDEGYEHETGCVIVETFKQREIKPLEVPGVLLHGHGPFTWGKDAHSAVMNAVVLEEVCKMNLVTRQLNSFGLAFFIKIFFDGAKKLVIGANGDVVKSKTYLIHGVLGVAFMIVARLITILL